METPYISESIGTMKNPDDERCLPSRTWDCPICKSRYILSPNEEENCTVCGNVYKTVKPIPDNFQVEIR